MSDMIQVVTTDGFTMEYITFGTGKKPLVILPGLSVQRVLPAAAAIQQRYALLEKEFTIYLFERRQELPPVYSVQDMARDTAKAMQALGLRKVCLFGASQGGMMAMLIAAQYPQLVERLALGSTACRVDEARFAAIRAWLAYAAAGDSEGLYLSFGEKVYPAAFFEKYRDAFVTMAKSVTQEDLARFTILAAGTEGFDASEQLARLTCPVLLLGSSDDGVLGADGAEGIVKLMQNTPHFSYHLYEGYGHAAYDLAPDYVQRLYRFFTQACI